ncbi:hypothetical protein AVEN_851-1 [Araneus ventricosus]|uniref:Uncharacterized protein n=1 Tax=Araneus ventricosus TaxID=182803 RepID=A0A4Y2EFI8_ARAVE|nr:hypothetical protein AVEN_851-1 [Araneus ventricosus]
MKNRRVLCTLRARESNISLFEPESLMVLSCSQSLRPAAGYHWIQSEYFGNIFEPVDSSSSQHCYQHFSVAFCWTYETPTLQQKWQVVTHLRVLYFEW